MVTIQNFTTENPIAMIGTEAGVCWGAPTSNIEKNIKRGLDCLKNNHGRTFEFPDIYMILDGYSARVIREFYTHIGGSPTRLQASTRYIEYGKFDYIIPKSITDNSNALTKYVECMKNISDTYAELQSLGIPKEDIANLLPLGMETKIVVKINLRTLMDMSRQRMCSRAYWEFREMFKDICNALRAYSEEWSSLVDEFFKPKCVICGYCSETKTCGAYPSKEEHDMLLKAGKAVAG